MEELNNTDPEGRTKLLQEAQKIISEDYANGYLFQLANWSLSRIIGLWPNSPTQAIDLTNVHWH